MENKPSLFLYARKSTDVEDKQVLSIDAQLSELRSLAKCEGLQIAAEFVEKRSAKMPGRPVFNERAAARPGGGMVDTRDLKSLGCKAVRVRAPPRAPSSYESPTTNSHVPDSVGLGGCSWAGSIRREQPKAGPCFTGDLETPGVPYSV